MELDRSRFTILLFQLKLYNIMLILCWGHFLKQFNAHKHDVAEISLLIVDVKK